VVEQVQLCAQCWSGFGNHLSRDNHIPYPSIAFREWWTAGKLVGQRRIRKQYVLLKKIFLSFDLTFTSFSDLDGNPVANLVLQPGQFFDGPPGGHS
jgi:hypothetical protein